MRHLQILLHITPMLNPFIPSQITPRATGAQVGRGAGVHALGHALRVGMRKVCRAAAAVVDAAEAKEAFG